ncbi:hypothetical protein L9F63_018916, partial [Diploptera punctata]
CKEITEENMEEIHLMGRSLRHGLRSFWRLEALKKESGGARTRVLEENIEEMVHI